MFISSNILFALYGLSLILFMRRISYANNSLRLVQTFS